MLQTTLQDLEERLVDYRLVSLLGRGGFADVFLGKDPAGNLVALKVGHERASGGRDVARSLQALGRPTLDAFGPDERLAVPALFAEHDVSYPSFGPSEVDAVLETEYRLLRRGGAGDLAEPLELLYRQGRAVLVLEYIQGPTLRTLVREGAPLDPGIFLYLLSALERIQTRGRLRYHGDLKPEHLIITPQGRVRLIDPAYRSPLVLAPDPLPTRPAALSATPEYNPFLLTGPAADLFAFAVILYELLAGRLPWPEEQVPWDWAGVVVWRASVLAALHSYLDIAAPHELVASAPRELSEAVMFVLRARGEGRDLIHRLRAALEAAPPTIGV